MWSISDFINQFNIYMVLKPTKYLIKYLKVEYWYAKHIILSTNLHAHMEKYKGLMEM